MSRGTNKNMGSLFDIIDKEVLNEAADANNRNIDAILGGLQPSDSVPIQPDESEWKILDYPERLARTFKFKEPRQRNAFVLELLGYQDENKHHSKITITSDKVIVESYTHDIDRVTELDKELAEFCDDLYEDVGYFFMSEEEENERSL